MRPGDRMTRNLVTTCLMASALLSGTVVQAQLNGSARTRITGRIVGRVVDQETGSGMAGVIIRITGGPVAVSGVGGRFLINSVTSGDVSLTVESLGYASKTVTDVTVPADGTVEVNVTLVPQALQLEALTVSAAAERGSVARAVEQQRQATSIVSAISAEQISRSPDSDAGAVMRRVSGVTVQDGKYVFVRGLGERYTTTSLNGSRIPSPEPERKVVPLDLFPAGLLQTITTSKTFTPDQPGDFSGALVDIRTREFPVERQAAMSVSMGYQPGTTFSTVPWAPSAGSEWLGLATKPRRLPREASNMRSDAPRGPEINRVVNSFRNVWSVQEQSARPNTSLSASLGGSSPVLGTRLGYLLSGTYSAGQSIKEDFRRALVAGEGGDERNRYDGTIGTYDVLWGGLANFSVLLGSHSRLLLNNSYNRGAENEARIEVGTDENTRSRVQVERLKYVERSVRSNQIAGEHQFGARSRIDWAFTHSGVTRDEPDRSEFVTWLDPAVPIWFNDFEGAVRTFGSLDESNREARLDYRLQLGATAGSAALKVGGVWRRTDRTADNVAYRILTFFWAEDDPRWQLPPEQIFDGRFAGDQDANFQIQREAAGGSYTADDALNAGYLMFDVPLGSKIRAIGGARLEHSETTVRAENTVGTRSLSNKTYNDLLPALTLNIDLSTVQKVRLSASQTLARPEYRELAPIRYREVLGGEHVTGNEDLERTLIQNYDLRWEWYTGPGEVFSLGGFYKSFDRPIEQRYVPTSGTDVLTYANAESAYNYGVELEVMKGLGSFSETLTPFTALLNATLMKSRVETGRATDVERRLVGQAPWVVNAGLTYARERLNATVLYNVVGPRIINARESGVTVADVIEQSRSALDLSIRFPMLRSATARLDLKNLLDTPFEVRQGDIVRQYYRSGRSITLGLNWRPQM